VAMWATAAGEWTPAHGPNPPDIGAATIDRSTFGLGNLGFFLQWPPLTGGLRLLTACSECKLCKTDDEVVHISHDDSSAEIVQLPMEEKHHHRKGTGEYSLPDAQTGGVSLHQQQEASHADSPTSCNQPGIFSEASVSTQFVSGTSSSDFLYTATHREQTAELSGTSTCGADVFKAVEQADKQTLPHDSKLPTVDPDAEFDIHRPISKGPGEAPLQGEFAKEQTVCLDLPSNLAAETSAPDATPECVGSTCSQQADCIGVARWRSSSLDACRGMCSHAQDSRIHSRSITTNPHGDMLASDQAASGDARVQLRESLPRKPETAAGTPDEVEQQPSVADVPTESAELIAAVEAAAAAQAELEAASAGAVQTIQTGTLMVAIHKVFDSEGHHVQAAAETTKTQELEAAAGAAPVPDIGSVAVSILTQTAPIAAADVLSNLAEKAGETTVKPGGLVELGDTVQDGERADLTEPLPQVLLESVKLQFMQDSCAKADISRATSSTAVSPLSLLSELGDSAESVADHKASTNLDVQVHEFLSPPTATFDNQLPEQVSQPAANLDVSQQAQTVHGSEPEPSKPLLLIRPGASIAPRAEAYAAACQLRSERPEKSLLQKRRAKIRPVSFDIPPDKPERPFRTLSQMMEQCVLKVGLGCLGEKMPAGYDVEHIELPRTSTGIPKLMQGSSFLRRLFQKEVELKSCMEGDVAAAQADLKYLRVEQLLSIRLPTLDFATESQSHNTRNSFLEWTDKHLFYKLAQRCLTECSQVPDTFEALHRLGIRISITLGVLDHLSKGWGTQPADSKHLLSLPPCWVMKLDSKDWPQQCRAAIFNSEELWVKSLPGEAPDFAAVAMSGHLAVVRDRTTGTGKDRMLHWEIVVMESCSTEDILYEMDRDPATNKKSSMTAELSATMLQRVAGTV